MTEQDEDRKLTEILEHHGLERCKCGKLVDRADVAWNNGSTEVGTPFSTLEIICSVCSISILHINTWYPWIDTFDEFLETLNDYIDEELHDPSS